MSTPTMPPMVYAPTQRRPHAIDQYCLQMHRVEDGRTALFVYSALDRLERYYGADASWAVMSVKDLQAAYEQVPYDMLLLDAQIQRTVPVGPA